jgi:hypothetical protein
MSEVEYITTKQVQLMLKVSYPTLRRMMQTYDGSPDIPWTCIGRQYRWRKDVIPKWLDYVHSCSTG